MAAMLWALYMLALGEKIPARRVWPGVLVSLAGWLAVSMAFSYYVEHFAHYAELYGSIATIVVSLLWLYWSGTVLIMGGELNAALIDIRAKRVGAAKVIRNRRKTFARGDESWLNSDGLAPGTCRETDRSSE